MSGAPQVGIALEEPQPRSSPHLSWTDGAGPHGLDVRDTRTLGSAPGVGIPVGDRAVSRLHAELAAREDGLWVRDLGSRNGTYVAGVKVQDARVPNGAVLKVGATEITVTYGSPLRPMDLWPEPRFVALVGRSAAMREVFANLAKLAHADVSVLVTGEPGTGKSATARALHDASPRADKPFVVVECAAFAAALLDGELFGHIAEDKLGAIESAEGGTLLLDDVSELPLPLQQKLAKVLEAKTTQRIGEAGPPEEARTFDVRLIATSSRDLRVMVNRGSFREDLYLRLAGAPVSIPPLRDRMADLPLLVAHVLAGKIAGPDLVTELAKLPWPGNVAELKLVVERLAGASDKVAALSSTSGSDALTMDITHRGIAGASPGGGAASGGAPAGSSEEPLPASLEPWFGAGYKDFREKWQDLGEHEYLKRLMLRTGRISSVASRESGLDRTYLYRLLKKHGV
jgi:two-component system response regulator GlrR